MLLILAVLEMLHFIQHHDGTDPMNLQAIMQPGKI
ncbi:hypothetical protein BLA14095_00463 [Burkholderia lata]|nr:hypothetical protein BLA14095_00463 [Burkholderia lata]